MTTANKTKSMPEMTENQERKKKFNEKHYYQGGPHGLGDPEDTYLRKVELEVMIPKKMREIAKVENCPEEVAKFTECCKDAGLLMTFKCRKENAALKRCLTTWYNDEGFKQRCKEEYLRERSEYRRTGIPTKQRQERIANTM